MDRSGGELEWRTEDPERAAAIRDAVVDNQLRRGEVDRLHSTGGACMGRTLADRAEDRRMDEVETALDAVLGDHAAGIVSHNMHEADIVRLMEQP
jgi:hypothetical protein